MPAMGYDYDDVKRHEFGHCNGWPKDHAGMRAFALTVAELQLIATRVVAICGNSADNEVNYDLVRLCSNVNLVGLSAALRILYWVCGLENDQFGWVSVAGKMGLRTHQIWTMVPCENMGKQGILVDEISFF
jgi:hypothetical protein